MRAVTIKIISIFVWLLVGCLYGICKILNKIYGLVGGILTVVFITLFLIVSIGYKDMQQWGIFISCSIKVK